MRKNIFSIFVILGAVVFAAAPLNAQVKPVKIENGKIAEHWDAATKK